MAKGTRKRSSSLHNIIHLLITCPLSDRNIFLITLSRRSSITPSNQILRLCKTAVMPATHNCNPRFLYSFIQQQISPFYSSLSSVNWIFYTSACCDERASIDCGWKKRPQAQPVAENTSNKKSRTADRGWYGSFGTWRGLKSHYRKRPEQN